MRHSKPIWRKDKKVTTNAEAKAFPARNLTDGNPESYWTTGGSVKNAFLTLDFGKKISFNRIVLQEYIKLGQRVSSFSVEYWDGQAYRHLDSQTTIGHKRILAFPTVNASKIKITISEPLAAPVLSEIGVYQAPDL